MGRLNNYQYPYNLAYDIFGSDDLFKNILPEYLKWVVSNDISARESVSVQMRYQELKSYDDISKEFGVTRERIRQILAKALRKMRNPAKMSRYIAVRKCEFDCLQQKYISLQMYAKKLEDSLNLSGGNILDLTAFLDTPIENLELSVRSYNCLTRHAKLETYSDLINYKLEDFLKIRNLGPRSFSEIMGKLSKLGFKACSGKHIYDLSEWNDEDKDAILIWEGTAE
jgi:hypothetical protein